MEQQKGILFIDIETVPVVPDYHLLPEQMQAEWARKSKFIKASNEEIVGPAMIFGDKAGIFSEFAKVVCIGFGSLQEQDKVLKMRLKALVNDDEKILLKGFCEVVTRFTNHHKEIRFCGHNIKEFDIPFLCRRMLINGISIPDCMNISGKKPWEVSHLDTMEMWKFGDFKNFTSLSLLAAVFGIPSPKTDIDGSQVANVYWNEKDLPRIGRYCLQDVLTSAKVYLKLKGINDVEIEPLFID